MLLTKYRPFRDLARRSVRYSQQHCPNFTDFTCAGGFTRCRFISSSGGNSRQRDRRHRHPNVALENFVAMPNITMKNANEVIEMHINSLEMVQLVDLLHVCSKQRHVVINRRNILRIKNQVESLSSKLRGPQIGKVMFSMKQFTSDDYAARLLLLALVEKIELNDEVLSGQTVANMTHGLRDMDASHWEVRRYLSVLGKKMLQCHQKLKYFELSSALYGLRGMDSQHAEVREVVGVLARKMEFSRDLVNSQVVSNCLYGMQSMSSRHEEVRYLLSVIRLKIEQSARGGGLRGAESMIAQAVGNALYGLQGMSSERVEVRRLLTSLAPLVEACSQTLTAQAVGNALYGLRGMSSEHDEVRVLLATLAPKVRSCVQLLSVQNIDNSFFGLQRMSSEHPEVRAVLGALVGKLGTRQLDSHALGSALFGLQGMSCAHQEVRAALSALTAALPPPSSRSSPQSPILAVNFAMAFSGLRLMNNHTPEVAALVARMLALMDSCAEPFKVSSLVNIMFGLQSMAATGQGNEQQEEGVRGVLAFVSAHLRSINAQSIGEGGSCDDPFEELTGARLGRALVGLQGMSSELSEVRSVLSELAITLEQQRRAGVCLSFSPLDLRRAGAGLRALGSEHEEVRLLLGAVTVNMDLNTPDTLAGTDSGGAEGPGAKAVASDVAFEDGGGLDAGHEAFFWEALAAQSMQSDSPRSGI